MKATRAELDATFSTNVSGPMVITQTFLPLLRAAPKPKVEEECRPAAVFVVVMLVSCPGPGAPCPGPDQPSLTCTVARNRGNRYRSS